MNFFLFKLISFSLILASSASAEPITIAGINWGQSSDQQQAIIRDKGLVCQPVKDVDPFTMQQLDYQKCSIGDAYIGVTEDTIRYGCALFNACDSEMQAVAQRLVDDGKIRTMSGEYLGRMTSRSPSMYKFCGDGEEGDRLCIYPESDGKFYFLVIEKSNFGKKTDFN